MNRLITFSAMALVLVVLVAAKAEKYADYPHMTVRELEKNESSLKERLVVVSGCYTVDFELSLLFACEDVQFVADNISWAGTWVDSVDDVPGSRQLVSTKLPEPSKRRTYFKKAKWGDFNQVIALGEYQTGGRHGHMDGYSSRFVVYDIVFEGKAQKLPPKTKNREP